MITTKMVVAAKVGRGDGGNEDGQVCDDGGTNGGAKGGDADG